MRFLREPRLTDFYDQATLERAGAAVWNAMRERCEKHGLAFEALRHSSYASNYVAGFGRCLGILHTVKPAESVLGSGWPEQFAEIAFAQEFDRWEAESMAREPMPAKFADGFGDGVQDGVAYFAGLPFANRGLTIGMEFIERFARLDWAIRQKAKG